MIFNTTDKPHLNTMANYRQSTTYLACEYSRLSFDPATTCESQRVTSAIRSQKFHTDDVNLSRILTGTLIGRPNNFA